MTACIRPLAPADRSQWLGLWSGYLEFYEASLSQEITDPTWTRILDPEAPIQGLCADDGSGELLGIVHYLFHPVTWAAGPRCYLEDLFHRAGGARPWRRPVTDRGSLHCSRRARRRPGLLAHAGIQRHRAAPLRSGGERHAVH